MRKVLTDVFIKSVPKPAAGRIEVVDVKSTGLTFRVTSNGARSWCLRFRDPRSGKPSRATIGNYPDVSLASARERADDMRRRIAGGNNPTETSPTLKAVLEEYLTREGGMKRDADGKATFSGKLRSAKQQLKVFERLVYPTKIGSYQIHEVKRSDIVNLLDQISDENGPVMADRTLAYVRRALNWHASRTDDFHSPIVRGMARTKPQERAGKRVLADDEIRDIWATLDAGAEDIPDCFARLQRCLFFAAVRRTEAAQMSWLEIETVSRDDYKGDVWTVPGSRMKGKLDHAVPFAPAVAAIIGERPRDAKARPFVFSTRGGRRPFSGYSKAKAALDREIAKLRKSEGREPMPPWTMQRDVRRTARTLMSRARVPSEIAERVLAHVIPGVEGVYDRYEYLPEKRDALEKLAAIVESVVSCSSAHMPQ